MGDKLTLLCVPAHCGMFGNVKLDQLSKKGNGAQAGRDPSGIRYGEGQNQANEIVGHARTHGRYRPMENEDNPG